MQNYSCNRQQKCFVNGPFSDWTEIITGVPQGSILDPLLFNKFLSGIFVFVSKCNFCNYTDDNTLYFTIKDLNRVKNPLK